MMPTYRFFKNQIRFCKLYEHQICFSCVQYFLVTYKLKLKLQSGADEETTHRILDFKFWIEDSKFKKVCSRSVS
ncbi:hypothetical protein Cal7507_1259 [Calothrix sp. PCC 7507]|nr:hypothetical protein Cal7507_1259 [Calothrix sp. PCC 7507]